MDEPLGQAVQRTIEIDFALKMGISQTPNYYEFSLLRILAEEKDKYQEEQIKKQSEQRKSNG